jgi:hypothetical protein
VDGGVVLANGFALRDLDGQVRAFLKLIDGAALVLCDAEGRAQVQFHALKSGARLTLGHGPAAIVADADPLRPSVALQDGKGRPRLTLLLIEGQPTIALTDAEGAARLHLRVDDDGCGFDLADADRRARFLVREEGGKARIKLVDDTGKVVFEKP